MLTFLYNNCIQASIYTLSLCRGHSRLVQLAKQETLTPPGHLVSALVCRGPWMSTVVLYCWCHSDSASVLLYFSMLKPPFFCADYETNDFWFTNFPFLSSNILSSPAYGVFISQPLKYDRTCSSYECFKLRARRLSSKLLRNTSWKPWNRHAWSFMIDTGILFSNIKSPSHEC